MILPAPGIRSTHGSGSCTDALSELKNDFTLTFLPSLGVFCGFLKFVILRLGTSRSVDPSSANMGLEIFFRPYFSMVKLSSFLDFPGLMVLSSDLVSCLHS